MSKTTTDDEKVGPNPGFKERCPRSRILHSFSYFRSVQNHIYLKITNKLIVYFITFVHKIQTSAYFKRYHKKSRTDCISQLLKI